MDGENEMEGMGRKTVNKIQGKRNDVRGKSEQKWEGANLLVIKFVRKMSMKENGALLTGGLSSSKEY